MTKRCVTKIGIIGGIGPEATIAYYRGVISSYRNRTNDGSYPQILINSIDLQRMLAFIESRRFESLTRYLTEEVAKLATAGAEFGVLASNTPHIVFDELRGNSPIPLLSIVEETAKEAKRLRLNRVGIFGTKFTMQNNFYQEIFAQSAAQIIVPHPNEQEYIHMKYMSELVNGVFLEETKRELVTIARAMQARSSIQGLILGGTELPLILSDDSEIGIQCLNTTEIHVKGIVDRMLNNREMEP